MTSTLEKKHAAEQLSPGDMPRDYYGFEHYVSKERMLTYWHQLNEILLAKPDKMLEIGIGSRVVAGVARSFGVEVTSADINETLHPDVVTPIAELDRHFEEGQFPFVLCARVLQHLPFEEFEPSLRQLHRVTGEYLLLTLPVETLRLYFRFRVTGRNPRTISLPVPLFVKRLLQGRKRGDDASREQNFWKIGQKPENSMTAVKDILGRSFTVQKAFQVPEDMSHAFFLLRKR